MVTRGDGALGSRAEDDRDYDVVKVKVKKQDKDGNDISGDKVGPGGRRREDGTLSAMYYDPEPLDESQDAADREALEAQLLDYALEEQRLKQERTQETIDLVFYGMERLMEFLANHPEVVLKIKDGACTFGRNIVGGVKSVTAKLMLKKSAAPKKRGPLTKAERILAKEQAVEVEGELFLTATEETRRGKPVTMSIEEARLEVLNVLTHYVEMKKGLQRLSNANVIEIQKLGFEGAIAQLENIVKQYPALMDERTETSLHILAFALDAGERERVKITLTASAEVARGR